MVIENGCKCYPNDIKELKISNVSCTELCSGYLLAFINQYMNYIGFVTTYFIVFSLFQGIHGTDIQFSVIWSSLKGNAAQYRVVSIVPKLYIGNNIVFR